jgi:hypothetical protein
MPPRTCGELPRRSTVSPSPAIVTTAEIMTGSGSTLSWSMKVLNG